MSLRVKQNRLSAVSTRSRWALVSSNHKYKMSRGSVKSLRVMTTALLKNATGILELPNMPMCCRQAQSLMGFDIYRARTRRVLYTSLFSQ